MWRSCQQEEFTDLFTQLGTAIFTGISLIYGVLVLLFRSFFKPITILAALPLAIGGAFLALLVTGMSVSLPSLIGLLMLLGLAAKNSILLVEYAIEREREGMSATGSNHRGLPRARPADHHDHHGDDGRHAADRPGARQGL